MGVPGLWDVSLCFDLRSLDLTSDPPSSTNYSVPFFSGAACFPHNRSESSHCRYRCFVSLLCLVAVVRIPIVANEANRLMVEYGYFTQLSHNMAKTHSCAQSSSKSLLCCISLSCRCLYSMAPKSRAINEIRRSPGDLGQAIRGVGSSKSCWTKWGWSGGM